VLADEAAAFGQGLDRAVEQDVGVGKLAPALDEKLSKVPAPPSMSIQPSLRVRR
jgi:hypothetical protein